jgi:hypothetical protein
MHELGKYLFEFDFHSKKYVDENNHIEEYYH